VGDQAETTVILLKGFIVQHISEPPQALRDSPLNRGAQAQKERGDGVCVSYAHLAFALFISFSHRSNKFEDLLQRESQLLHKYDKQAAYPESFQRISNLSGIDTQVKWQSYLYKNVLKVTYCIEYKRDLIGFSAAKERGKAQWSVI
jgi:hypothetical protein